MSIQQFSITKIIELQVRKDYEQLWYHISFIQGSLRIWLTNAASSWDKGRYGYFWTGCCLQLYMRWALILCFFITGTVYQSALCYLIVMVPPYHWILSLNNDLCLYRGRFAARKDVSYENFPAGALRQAACRFSCLMGWGMLSDIYKVIR